MGLNDLSIDRVWMAVEWISKIIPGNVFSGSSSDDDDNSPPPPPPAGSAEGDKKMAGKQARLERGKNKSGFHQSDDQRLAAANILHSIGRGDLGKDVLNR